MTQSPSPTTAVTVLRVRCSSNTITRCHALATASQIQTGQVDVNDPEFNFSAPFGGYKQSDNGARGLGTFGFDEYTRIKSIHS